MRRSRAEAHPAPTLALVLALAWAFPVYWMLNSAFLPNVVLQSATPTFLPFGGSLDNLLGVATDARSAGAGHLARRHPHDRRRRDPDRLPRARWPSAGSGSAARASFVLALLLIQMLPAEGLFIAQYKMMSSLGLLNQAIGLAVLYTAAVVPFTIWMLRGFVAGVPADLEEAAMVDGLSRTQAFLQDHLPAAGPRAGRLGRLRLPAGVERVHRRPGGHDRGAVAHPAAVAARVRAGERQPGDRLGPGDGRLDARRRARHHLLPHRPGPDEQRARRRGGEGMTPRRGRRGHPAARLPRHRRARLAGARPRRGAGLGVPLRRQRDRRRRPGRALREPARPDAGRAPGRRRGGRRRHPAALPRRARRPSATPCSGGSTTRRRPARSAAGIGARAAPRSASGSTSRPTSTSTPPPTTRSSACAASATTPTSSRATPRPGSRACSRRGSPPAPSTSPATVTPWSTRTTACRAST